MGLWAGGLLYVPIHRSTPVAIFYYGILGNIVTVSYATVVPVAVAVCHGCVDIATSCVFW